MQNEQEVQMDKEKILKEQFLLIRVLGEGVYGKVYLIRDNATQTQYALKQYSRYQLEKEGKYRSLVRSVYILQHLDHPSIIRLVSYIVNTHSDSTIYTLFEPCKKGSLENIKQSLRTLKMNILIKLILLQLAEALSYLKSVNVAHRDIKPSNITFTSEGALKLIDFDEAVCFSEKFSSQVQNKMFEQFGFNLQEAPLFLRSKKSRASNFVGTQFYMSPEMVESTVGDEKGDLWAYGCILYELVVGDYLHIEFDSQQLFESQLSTRLQSFAAACSDPDALSLFKDIAKYHPKERIDIDKVIRHPYFHELRKPGQKEAARLKLTRFLRGNYNIQREKSYNCYGMCLDLQNGLEIYRELKTVVLLQTGKQSIYYEIMSGPKYFKFKHCKNERDRDFYVRYDRIDRILRQGNTLELYYYADRTEQVLEVRTLKHLYPNMLTPLLQIMETILRD